MSNADFASSIDPLAGPGRSRLGNLLGDQESFSLERRILNGVILLAAGVALLVTLAVFLLDRSLESKSLGLGGSLCCLVLLYVSRLRRPMPWLPWVFLFLVLGIMFYDYLLAAGHEGIALPLMITMCGVMPMVMPQGHLVPALGILGLCVLAFIGLGLAFPERMLMGDFPASTLIYNTLESGFFGAGLAAASSVLIFYYRRKQHEVEALNHRLGENNRQLQERYDSLEQAMSEIKTLRGIIPICSFCKRLRTDDGYYQRVEDYLAERADVDFSHTFCPECAREHYPELLDDLESRGESLGEP